MLCVHCGVGAPGALKIERRARNGPYIRLDNKGTFPADTTCLGPDGADVITTSLDVQSIISEVLKVDPATKLQLSDDAGLYLCEYVHRLM